MPSRNTRGFEQHIVDFSDENALKLVVKILCSVSTLDSECIYVAIKITCNSSETTKST